MRAIAAILMTLVAGCCLFLAVLVCPGCSTPVESGTVVGHSFTPAHSTTEMYYMGDSLWMPFEAKHPDAYEVRVRDTEGRLHWVRVSKEDHDRLKFGDEYRRP